ncbi:conserved hypothetical protein, partial [Ricinus communis]
APPTAWMYRWRAAPVPPAAACPAPAAPRSLHPAPRHAAPRAPPPSSATPTTPSTRAQTRAPKPDTSIAPSSPP